MRMVLANMKPVEDRLADDAPLDTARTAKVMVKYRTGLGISQKQLASEMGISASYLCDLEKGRRRIRQFMFDNARRGLAKLLE